MKLDLRLNKLRAFKKSVLKKKPPDFSEGFSN